jgi:hypothetical protein
MRLTTTLKRVDEVLRKVRSERAAAELSKLPNKDPHAFVFEDSGGQPLPVAAVVDQDHPRGGASGEQLPPIASRLRP